ncbi:MAG TPA: hypothetical protein VF230_03595 [Acidimicrobiales bacterium]
MIGDFERPGRRRAAQDRALRRYLATQVRPYSPWYGETLRNTPVESVDDLVKLPLVSMDDAPDPSSLVLRPTMTTIAGSGDRRLLAKIWWARMSKGMTRLNRTQLEPAYKPIHWHMASVPLGYTAEDLDRLAELGRSTLEMAGVDRYDVLVSVRQPEPSPAFWQLALGARLAGVSALFLPVAEGPEAIAQLRPNVLAGSAVDLLRLLEDGRSTGFSFAGLRTLLVVGEPIDPMMRGRLAELAGTSNEPAAVVAAWAPPGVRALWTECRNGTDVHTWPAAEVIEMIDPATGGVLPPATEGEVVYTPLGWKGSVLLRLRTGVFGCLDDTPCVSCGRTSPRIRLVPSLPPFASILDEHADVELWQAELRTVDGSEELIVFVTPRRAGHPGPLLRELDRQLSVTQFVVLDRRALAARLRASGEARVVDLRDE